MVSASAELGSHLGPCSSHICGRCKRDVTVTVQIEFRLNYIHLMESKASAGGP